MSTEGFLQVLPDAMSSGGGTEPKGHGFMPRPHAFSPSILGGLEVLSSPRSATFAAHGASHRTVDSWGHTGRHEEGSRLSGSDLLIRPLAAGTLELHQSHQP